MKTKKKMILKYIFEMFVGLFVNVLLWLLIWTGAIIALLKSEELFLAVLLFLSGIAKVYQEHINYSQSKQKESKK